METPIFKLSKIGSTQYVPSHPEEDNGYDYNKHEDWLVLPNDIWMEAGPVRIDTLIGILTELTANGANYVSCDWHCDHGELEVTGFEFRKASEIEITEYRKKMAEKEANRKANEIRQLEEKLNRLRNE